MNQTEAELLNNGLGNVTWWGYSPAKNLLENFEATNNEGNNKLLSLINH